MWYDCTPHFQLATIPIQLHGQALASFWLVLCIRLDRALLPNYVQLTIKVYEVYPTLNIKVPANLGLTPYNYGMLQYTTTYHES